MNNLRVIFLYSSWNHIIIRRDSKLKPSLEFLLLLMSESTEVGEGTCWGDRCSTIPLSEWCAPATPTIKWWLLRSITWRGSGPATVCCCTSSKAFWSWYIELAWGILVHSTQWLQLCSNIVLVYYWWPQGSYNCFPSRRWITQFLLRQQMSICNS